MSTALTSEQLHRYARTGAKQAVRSILATFPGLDREIQQEAARDRAAHARAAKQAKQHKKKRNGTPPTNGNGTAPG